MTHKNSNFFVKLTVAVFVIFSVITIFRMQMQLNTLKQTKETAIKQLNTYSLRVEELQERLETPMDRDYIIRIAREKMGYALPNEIIFYNDLIR